MKNLNYNNKNIERKCLEHIRKNQFLKVNNSVLELEKDFIELKDRIKRKIGEIFSNQLLCLWMMWISLHLKK